MAEMAKKMKMGRETFVRKFSSQFGVSPKLFFHRLRAAASQCLAQRMEKIVPKVLYPREGRTLESEKIVHLDSMH